MALARSNQHAHISNTWQWLLNGWQTLRDKTVNAVTYFTPQHEHEAQSQRWGVLATDVSEHSNDVVAELELPGLEKSDLAVQVHKERLVISGEKPTSSTRHEGSLVVNERAYGRFERVIPLPCDVQSDGTTAKYDNGVLTVTMPKDSTAKSKSIPIKTG